MSVERSGARPLLHANSSPAEGEDAAAKRGASPLFLRECGLPRLVVHPGHPAHTQGAEGACMSSFGGP